MTGKELIALGAVGLISIAFYPFLALVLIGTPLLIWFFEKLGSK